MSNIHSESKKGDDEFWSNISQDANCCASIFPTAPISSNILASSSRSSMTRFLYLRFVFTVLAPNIRCFASFISASLFRMVSDVKRSASLFSILINVLADTNFASRFGKGRIPKLSTGLLFVFWSTTKEMKKRSLLICIAIGWISTP